MKPGQVRIIAGKWRGRRLPVADIKGLRPTPDRVRETLFNWLAPIIQDTYCLDLFSGTGVLGFEALSRGAANVVMIDQSPAIIQILHEAVSTLGAENILIYQAAAPKQLRPTNRPFDIVFLDPPYDSGLLLPCCHYLEENNFLADTAYIYLETKDIIKDNDLPAGWHIIKNQRAGQVVYYLARREK